MLQYVDLSVLNCSIYSLQASKGLQLLVKDHEEVKDTPEAQSEGEKNPLLSTLKKLNLKLSDVEVL